MNECNSFIIILYYSLIRIPFTTFSKLLHNTDISTPISRDKNETVNIILYLLRTSYYLINFFSSVLDIYICVLNIFCILAVDCILP